MSYKARGGSGYGNFHRARNFHASRNTRSRSMDEKFTAKAAPSEEAWLRNPNKWDLPTVDTPLSSEEMRMRSAIIRQRAILESSPYSTTKYHKEHIIQKAAGRDFSPYQVEQQYDAMVKEGKLKAPGLRISETSGVIRHKGELYKFFSGADTQEQANMYARLAKVGDGDKVVIKPPDPERNQQIYVVYRKISAKPQQDQRFIPYDERQKRKRDAEKKVLEHLTTSKQRLIDELGLPVKPSLSEDEAGKYRLFDGPTKSGKGVSSATQEVRDRYAKYLGLSDEQGSNGLLLDVTRTSGLVVGDLTGSYGDKIKNAVTVQKLKVTPQIRKDFKNAAKLNFNGALFSSLNVSKALKVLDTSKPISFMLSAPFSKDANYTQNKLLIIKDSNQNAVIIAPRIEEKDNSLKTKRITSYKDYID